MAENVLKVIDDVMAAFSERRCLSAEDILALAGTDSALFARCIAFLQARGEVLLAADERALYHRPRLVTEVWELVRSRGALRPEDISAVLSLPNAITCEIVGWLEREGRVTTQAAGDSVIVSAG